MRGAWKLLFVGLCLVGAYVAWETAGDYAEADMSRRERHYRSICLTLMVVAVYYAYKGMTGRQR